MSGLLQLAVGSVFAGDFRIVRPLSEGGMGAVYVVEQISTGKERALKVMQPSLVTNDKLRERFAQEARVASRIESEHVVEVVGAGVDASTGTPWLAMELLKGETLADRVAREGALAPSAVLELYVQLCHAIGAAHDAGIVHRDLKPENVFLAVSRRAATTASFTVKVLDFGIAKIVAEAKTKHTAAIGTPLWMAPEQTEVSAQIHPTADVWALGLIAFHLLTGRLYWRVANTENASAMAMMREVCFEPIVAASERARELGAAALPAGFDEWFSRCVTRDIAARFRDARAAGGALDAALRGAPATAMRTAIAPLAPRVATELMPVIAAPTASRPIAHATVPMEVHASATTASTPIVASEHATTPRPNRTLLVAVAIGALVLASGIAFVATRGGEGSNSSSPPTTSVKPEGSLGTAATAQTTPTVTGAVKEDAGGIPAPPDVAAPPADAKIEASGLATKVLAPGTGTNKPTPKSEVTVHYTGWTTDGKMFDSSVARGQPAKFALDAVIAGWTEGVQLMVTGEKRRMWIPEKLAYKGMPGRPAGMLVFDVELISYTNPTSGPASPAPVSAPTISKPVANTDSTTKSEDAPTGPTPGICTSYKGNYSQAMKGKDFECVRAMLLPRLNAGTISSPEARYLKAACGALGDAACEKRAAEAI